MLSKIEENAIKNECVVPLMQTLLSLMLSVKLQDTTEKNIFTNVLQKLLEVAEIDDTHLKVTKIYYILLMIKALG